MRESCGPAMEFLRTVKRRTGSSSGSPSPEGRVGVVKEKNIGQLKQQSGNCIYLYTQARGSRSRPSLPLVLSFISQDAHTPSRSHTHTHNNKRCYSFCEKKEDGR
jgi:hypothetical protein